MLLDEAVGTYHSLLLIWLLRWRQLTADASHTAALEVATAAEVADLAAVARAPAGRSKQAPSARTKTSAPAGVAPLEAAISRCLLKLGDLGKGPVLGTSVSRSGRDD